MSKEIIEAIKDVQFRKRITVIKLARMIGKSPSSIYKVFESESISVNMLFQISKALGVNFFKLFNPLEETKASNSDSLNYKEENLQLKSQITALEQEIKYLKEINSLLSAKANLTS